jgi:hypothetical protein
LICGSVEAFLENPNLLYGYELDNKNFTWMRAVTKEEAQIALQHWTEWAAKPKEERQPKGHGVGEWIHEPDKSVVTPQTSHPRYLGPYNSWDEHKAAIDEMNRREQEIQQYDLKDSLTPGAKQLDWKTPTEFPQTPQQITETPLQDYLANLPKGAIYTRNRWGESPVYDAAISEDGTHLAVVAEISGVTNYALSEVYFQDGFFVHKSIRTFFTEEGAQKFFTESRGLEWTGGDVLEDYC